MACRGARRRARSKSAEVLTASTTAETDPSRDACRRAKRSIGDTILAAGEPPAAVEGPARRSGDRQVELGDAVRVDAEGA